MKKKLSVLSLVIVSLVLMAGCAGIQNQYNKQKAAFDACLAQTEPGGCAEKAYAWKSKGETVGELGATAVATVVPGAAPAIKPVSKGAGYLFFGLAAIIFGHGVIAEKNKPPVVPPTV